MFGPPKDVEGECNCRFEVGDDFGDNSTTFRCQLPPGHDGPHVEKFTYSAKQERHLAVITWPVGNADTEEALPCADCELVDDCEGLEFCSKVPPKDEESHGQ